MGRPNSGLNIGGIYKIQSIIKPDRVYIGSAVNFRHRRNIHFRTLRKNKHKNPKLQAHYNKYGGKDLVFSILVVCDIKYITPEGGVIWLEQFFLDAYKPWFNIAKIAGSSLGVKRSDKTKALLSRIKGNKTDEEKRKCGEHNIGRIPWNKGMKFGKQSPELVEKRVAPMRGRKRPPFSQEWRDNLSKSHMGHKQPQGVLDKRSKAMKLVWAKKKELENKEAVA